MIILIFSLMAFRPILPLWFRCVGHEDNIQPKKNIKATPAIKPFTKASSLSFSLGVGLGVIAGKLLYKANNIAEFP